MFIQESDLFTGMSPEITSEIDRLVEQRSLGAGEHVFKRQEPASHFYILDEGHVRLMYGEKACMTLSVTVPGQAFGLSSLVGREVYAATATCVAPTRLKMIEKGKLMKLFDKYPKDGMTFFNRLSWTIYQRLIDNYNTLLGVYQGEVARIPSYG